MLLRLCILAMPAMQTHMVRQSVIQRLKLGDYESFDGVSVLTCQHAYPHLTIPASVQAELVQWKVRVV